MPAERVVGPGAASVVVVGAEERTDRPGAVVRDVAVGGGGRGGQVGDALGQGQVMTTLRRGRGRGGRAGSHMAARDLGVGRQDDAAAWFLAAADMDGSSVAEEPMDVAHSQSGPAQRQGVVSGFGGAERRDGALAGQAQRGRDAMSRTRARMDDGSAGAVVEGPNLAAEYARDAESRRSLQLLSDEDMGRVLQQFLVDHASVGEAVRVVASDISRVRNALVSDARLRDVLQHLLGGCLRGDPGQDFWDRMVRTFLGHLHLVHRPPRRLRD